MTERPTGTRRNAGDLRNATVNASSARVRAGWSISRLWLVCLWVVVAVAQGCSGDVLCAASAPTKTPSPKRMCLSLAALAREAARVQAADRPLRKEFKALGGINWIEGYVADKDSGDVILVGRCIPGRPRLHIDDLVVNARNIWDGRRYPFCSLDPKPKDVAGVQRLLAGAVPPRNVKDVRQLFRGLKKTWGDQVVVLGGVPRNSRHAHAMIDSDYHMKRVSLGLVELEGIISPPDRWVRQAKKAIRPGRRAPADGPSMSRFWFHIKEGHPTFQESDGIVWLDGCSVVLLTKKQAANANGKLRDAGKEDPIAKAFAAQFSARFREAAAKVPEYAQLESLYRLIAVLRAMHLRKAAQLAGLDLNYYRRRHQYLAEKKMPKTKPGLANYKEATFDQSLGGGALKPHTLSSMVCGGVSMAMPVQPKQFDKRSRTDLKKLRLAVLRSRPRHGTVCWSVQSETWYTHWSRNMVHTLGGSIALTATQALIAFLPVRTRWFELSKTPSPHFSR